MMNINNSQSQCQAALPYYYDYLSDQWEQIPDAISAHIADCPNCQQEIQWLKEADSDANDVSLQDLNVISQTAQIQLHCALINKAVRCSTIKSFLPILAIPEMTVRISTPVTEHIKACGQCAKDLDTLKQSNLSPEQLTILSELFTQKQTESSNEGEKAATILPKSVTEILPEAINIFNRPDSGTITCCRPKDSSKLPSDDSFTVEVTTEEGRSSAVQSPAEPLQTSQVQRSAPAPTRSRWFIKPLAAAAALIIIVFLFFQNSAVQATDIGQIYKALKNIQNVKMTQYDVDIAAPIQTIWISRSREIKLFKTNDEYTLYDIANKIKKVKETPASDIQQTKLDRSMIEKVTKTMDRPWGLLPYNKTSELPEGAVWKKVQAKGDDLSSEPFEIFDLFWTQKTIAGNDIGYQWRCHVDPETKRPFKVEWRRREQENQEYKLTTIKEISYPTEKLILQVIEQAGF